MKTPVILCLAAALLVPSRAHADAGDLAQGKALPSGIGGFADPTNYHGLTGGLTLNLGASDQATSIGYENATMNLHWATGTNAIGRHLSILGGGAVWQTPALSTVYRAADFSATADTKSTTTTPFVMGGLGVTLFGERDAYQGDPSDPSYTNDPRWATKQAALDQLDLAIAQCVAGNLICTKKANRARDEFVWKNILRPALRTPTLSLGALFRLGAVGTVSAAEAVDTFVAFGAGSGIVDFNAAAHWMHTFTPTLIVQDAYTLSAGTFIDLSDSPPPPVLGIAFALSKYEYYSSANLPNAATTVVTTPNATRFDAVVSISGGPATTSAGIGVRYSRIVHSETTDENQFVVLLSSSIRLAD